MALIKYFEDGDVACFNGLFFRRDKKTGYYLNAKTHKRLHVYMWEYFNGKVPNGFHVHHVDCNKDNNEIANLKLLEKSEHAKFHADNISVEQKQKMRENLIANALPLSKKWHKSEEGKKWHSEHALKYWDNAPVNKYVCTNCGEMFESRNVYPKNSNRFCSNKCKSAYRRKMGYDDIVKICENCKKEYIENKYQKSKLCKDCRNKRTKTK